MKKYKKLSLILLSLILTFSIISGCSKADESSQIDSGIVSPELPRETPEFTGDKSSSIEPEKVITTITMNMETLEYEKTLDRLNQLIEANNGYIVNSQISYDSYVTENYNKYDRYAYYEIRIPKDYVMNFKKAIADIGNITSEYTSKQDVSKYYKDTESRLRVLETKEERLLSLLEKAERIEDIIAIENQLSDVITQKEYLKSELQGLDERIDFTTFSVSIYEVNKLTSSAGVNASFFTKLKVAFNDAIDRFSSFIEQFIIFIVSNIFFIVLLAVLIYFIVKYFMKRNNMKRNKKNLNYPPEENSEKNKS
ncbi:MAG: DUF4349 domain-containing protein [Tissierellales bacterium]|nr:DUF4349 domain-containing protein [Tissierellales bacterium]